MSWSFFRDDSFSYNRSINSLSVLFLSIDDSLFASSYFIKIFKHSSSTNRSRPLIFLIMPMRSICGWGADLYSVSSIIYLFGWCSGKSSKLLIIFVISWRDVTTIPSGIGELKENFLSIFFGPLKMLTKF